MKIQRGIVKYKDRDDIECTYGVTDDNRQYYFLDNKDEKKFSNGNRIASTALVEAIDPMVKANNIGVIDIYGNEIIPFENKSIRTVNDDIILVEKAVPISQSVLDSIALRNDPLSATKLVSTPATIKEKMNSKIGNDGRYIFNDQFSEATVCDINGNNLVNNEYYSFIALANNKLYFSKNTIDSPITEYSILPNEVQSDITPNSDTNEIDVKDVNVDVSVVENALTKNSDENVVIPIAPSEDTLGNEKDGLESSDDKNGFGEVSVSSDAESTDSKNMNSLDSVVSENVQKAIDISEQDLADVQVSDASDNFSVEEQNVLTDSIHEVSQNLENVDDTTIENKAKAEDIIEDNLQSENNDQANDISLENMDSKDEDLGTVSLKNDDTTIIRDNEDTSVDSTILEEQNEQDESVLNINDFEEDIKKLDDKELKEKTNELANEEVFENIGKLSGTNVSDKELALNIDDSFHHNSQSNSDDEDDIPLNVDNSLNVASSEGEVHVDNVYSNDLGISDGFSMSDDQGYNDLLDNDYEDIFKDSVVKADRIDNSDDYFDSFQEKSYKPISSDKDTIMSDIAKSMTDLMKQNRDQRSSIIQYQGMIETLRSNGRAIADKAKILQQKNENLASKVRNFEVLVSKLESRNQILENKVREQENIIASQSHELQGKEDLVKLLADAQSLLREDNSSYSFSDDTDRYYRRAA